MVTYSFHLIFILVDFKELNDNGQVLLQKSMLLQCIYEALFMSSVASAGKNGMIWPNIFQVRI